MGGAAYFKNGFLGKWRIVDFLLGDEAPQTPFYFGVVYQISKLGQIRLPDLKFVYQISKLGQIRLPDLEFVYQITKLGQIHLPDLKIEELSEGF